MLSVHNTEAIRRIEASIGYTFRDKRLLVQVFTRKTYMKIDPEAPDNEVLEFYGDMLLSYHVTTYFVEKFAHMLDDGLYFMRTVEQFTEMRSHYVRNQYLTDRIKQLIPNIERLVRAQNPRSELPKDNQKAYADLFESLVGAVYLDSWRDDALIRAFILRHLNLEPKVAPEAPAGRGTRTLPRVDISAIDRLAHPSDVPHDYTPEIAEEPDGDLAETNLSPLPPADMSADDSAIDPTDDDPIDDDTADFETPDKRTGERRIAAARRTPRGTRAVKAATTEPQPKSSRDSENTLSEKNISGSTDTSSETISETILTENTSGEADALSLLGAVDIPSAPPPAADPATPDSTEPTATPTHAPSLLSKREELEAFCIAVGYEAPVFAEAPPNAPNARPVASCTLKYRDGRGKPIKISLNDSGKTPEEALEKSAAKMLKKLLERKEIEDARVSRAAKRGATAATAKAAAKTPIPNAAEAVEASAKDTAEVVVEAIEAPVKDIPEVVAEVVEAPVKDTPEVVAEAVEAPAEDTAEVVTEAIEAPAEGTAEEPATPAETAQNAEKADFHRERDRGRTAQNRASTVDKKSVKREKNTKASVLTPETPTTEAELPITQTAPTPTDTTVEEKVETTVETAVETTIETADETATVPVSSPAGEGTEMAEAPVDMTAEPIEVAAAAPAVEALEATGPAEVGIHTDAPVDDIGGAIFNDPEQLSIDSEKEAPVFPAETEAGVETSAKPKRTTRNRKPAAKADSSTENSDKTADTTKKATPKLTKSAGKAEKADTKANQADDQTNKTDNQTVITKGKTSGTGNKRATKAGADPTPAKPRRTRPTQKKATEGSEGNGSTDA